MTNFSVNYCYQFMMMLQGRIPVRVRLFLIVNRTFASLLRPLPRNSFSHPSFQHFLLMHLFQRRPPLATTTSYHLRFSKQYTAPGWFDKIWSIMKNMLAADFRKKVHMIRESQLPDFLADGYPELAG
jgi:hypothetical protein